VFVLEFLHFVWIAPGLFVFEGKALAISGWPSAFARGRFGRAVKHPVSA
jgi:hypothetical protein